MLQSNEIVALPASISRLTDLKALSIASNKLALLPDVLGTCINLRLLDVGGNVLVRVCCENAIGPCSNEIIVAIGSN